MSDFLDDDDVPWADPQIQADYQAALGEFLVRFNGLENIVGDVLERALGKLGRPDLYINKHDLRAKLHDLEIVGLALPKLHVPDFKKIRDLNGQRNTLAHGHFDQNPFSGDYAIRTQGGKSIKIPLSTIQDLCKRAEEATLDVSYCMAYLVFADVIEALPFGPRPPDE